MIQSTVVTITIGLLSLFYKNALTNFAFLKLEFFSLFFVVERRMSESLRHHLNHRLVVDFVPLLETNALMARI